MSAWLEAKEIKAGSLFSEQFLSYMKTLDQSMYVLLQRKEDSGDISTALLFK